MGCLKSYVMPEILYGNEPERKEDEEFMMKGEIHGESSG